MMERNYFLSKSSFAVFIWLAIVTAAIMNSGSVSISVNKVYKDAEVAILHSIDSVSKLLTPISETMRSIPAFKDISLFQEPLAVKATDLQCMSENIYYEAGNQSYAGKIAVGEVVLNRTKTEGYPSTICGVIFDGSKNIHTSTCQFSWTCAKHAAIDKSSGQWAQSVKVAKELLSKKDMIVDITDGATNYHADYVNPPWSKTLKMVTQIDQHIFYRK